MAAHGAGGPGAPRLTFLPELLDIHFGELQNLWARRRLALRSAEHTPRTLAALDERIEAHTQGLLAVAGPARALVEPALAGGDPDAAFAAAHAMLRLGDPGAARAVVDAAVAAPPGARRGLAEALAHAPAAAVEPHYAALAAAGAPGAMAVATEALAFRGVLRAGPAASALDALVADDDPEVRAAGWRAAGYLGAALATPRYAAAWCDDAAEVRGAALDAAAWAGVRELVAFGRACAARPRRAPAEALHLLAVLAGPDDAPRVAAVACAPGARPAHVLLLGTLGSPAYADRLVELAADADPAVAAAAGDAFRKLTGHDVASGRTASTAAPDADPFDAAFAEVVRLPDPERMREVWAGMRAGAAGAARLCGGVDVSGPPDGAAERLDLASRREWYLRARFAGRWDGPPAALEALGGASPLRAAGGGPGSG